jgi:hypothetical protein
MQNKDNTASSDTTKPDRYVPKTPFGKKGGTPGRDHRFWRTSD